MGDHPPTLLSRNYLVRLVVALHGGLAESVTAKVLK